MRATIELHHAHPAHADAIARLRADAYGHRGARKEDHSLVRESIAAGQLWLVALRDGEVIGYSATIPISPLLAEIDSIHIDRRFRGGGIGTALIRETFRLHQQHGVASTVVHAVERVTGALQGIGVQVLPAGHSVGLATADGDLHTITPTARRPHLGVGMFPQAVSSAVAWAVDTSITPDITLVADSFIDTFSVLRRAEAVAALGDDTIIEFLLSLGRLDLVKQWTEPARTA
jgi:GNAT superfamily N-acetyltransferase